MLPHVSRLKTKHYPIYFVSMA